MLLHGVGHHWQAWQPVIERLAGEFDVIACDSPGFGRSAPLPAAIEPTIPAYADAFEWFFAELGLERPHVAGNSMGGAIALELARRRAALGRPPSRRRASGRPPNCASASVSLAALGGMPRRCCARRRGARAHARRTRRAVLPDLRLPRAAAGRGGGRDAHDAWASPALAARARGVRRVPLRRARGAARHARDDRLGHRAIGCSPTACRRRGRARCCRGPTRDARRGPRPVLRRSRGVAEVIRCRRRLPAAVAAA